MIYLLIGLSRKQGRVTIILAIFFIAALVVGLVSWSVVESSTVTVTASVTTSVTCSTDNASTAFGALSSASIATASPNASTTLSCNTGLGCTLSVNDANAGLATTSPAYTIPTTRGTLSAGTEGYGANATTTAGGSGGTLTMSTTTYNRTGNDVERFNTTSTVLASSTSAVSGRLMVMTFKAAISGTTQAANPYTDTVTYSCAGN